MSVVIRLARVGRKKVPFYHVVVADKRRARDGRYIEKVGHFNPLQKENNLVWDAEKIQTWLDKGAMPSERVAKMLLKEGVGSDKQRARFQKDIDLRVKGVQKRLDAEKAAKEAEEAAAKAAEEAEKAAAEAPAEEAAAE